MIKLMQKSEELIKKLHHKKIKTHSGPKKPWETSLSAVIPWPAVRFLRIRIRKVTKALQRVNKKYIRQQKMAFKKYCETPK